ncbi:MAG: GntR family transcriptional regulator [Candidatus Thioglobus sp.]|jgi:GntR family transcriptional regulator|nr:GntR family transcriptional regulator [Candidatus Thioglobus sp.]
MTQKLYQKVIDFINSQINSGELIIGDLIPSESQLSKKLSVSIGTVRKAIDKLENRKVLYRHHGKGTYVSDHGFDNSIFNFFSYGKQDGSSIRIYKTTPIRIKEKASAEIAFQLGINQGDNVIYLQRLGYIDKKSPIIVEKSWWVAEVVEGLQDHSIHIPDLLYAVILKQFNTQITSSQEVLTAGISNSEIAETLHINKGAPVVILNRHSYAKDKGLVEFRITTGRADMFSYTTTIGNPDA